MSNKLNISGHLEIYKKYKDGSTEKIFDDHNIIVSGMGVGLSYLFTGSGSNSILDYQIDRFQVGVSGPPEGGETSAIYELSGALTGTEYGINSNLYIEEATQITNETTSTTIAARIPKNKITKIDKTSVRYTLVLDEDACNNLVRSGQDLNLNEIGMLMKNPTGYATNRPILVCYRTFGDIRKTDDFSLIFRWTLNF